MATSGLGFAGILENAASEGAAFAAGLAIGPTLAPLVRFLENEAWAEAQTKPLDPGAVAGAQAQGYTGSYADGAEATYSGLNSERLAVLAYIASTAPGTAELLELWRRGRIDQSLVTAGLKKAGLRDEYIAPVLDLFDNPLDPAIIATAIQRGIMTDPGFLPVGPPTGVGNVEAFPVSPLDPLVEAQWSGISKERLFVETAIVGLPLALVEAAQGYYRGVLTLDDFKRAVAEGNTRNEWGDAALEVSRQILTAGEYSEAELRGYSTTTERLANTAKHGMSPADSDLLHLIQGRPIAVHQVTTGLARGGKYGGLYTDVPEPYQDAIRQSNVKEPWAGLDYANRYSYPSAFVIRALATAGELTPGDVNGVLLAIGWPPDLAVKVVRTWTGAKLTGPTPETVAEAVNAWGGAAAQTAAIDANVKKAHTKAWTEAQTSYIAQESTAADVQPIFTLLGLDPATQPAIIAAWDAIRALVRKQLTPAEIRKALGDGLTNPATGVAWTTADATAALLARGYDPADAAVFLEE